MSVVEHSAKIRSHFDKAVHYRRFASIQKKAAYSLIQRIEKQLDGRQPHHILELGCGDGLLTNLLREKWPQAQIIASDFSDKMLQRAKENMGEQNISFKKIDISAPNVTQKFDLICSNMAFQWVEEEEKVIKKWLNFLKRNGVFALSTLLNNSFCEWRSAAQHFNIETGIHNYPSFDAVKDWDFYPAQAYWKKENYQQCFSHGWEFLSSLKETGAATPREDYQPVKQHILKDIVHYFDQEFNASISWELGFGIIEIPPREGVFVTGTDTDIGKTIASAVLVKAWQGQYWKLLQTGLRCEKADLHTVMSLVGNPPCYPSYGNYQAPLCPQDAAQEEGKKIDLSSLHVPQPDNDKPIIVEGAGGVMVPVTEKQMMIDLIQSLCLPVVIVTRSDVLGTINHTLLTIEALRKRHIEIAGVILNGENNPGFKRQILEKGKVRILAQFSRYEHVTPHVIYQLSKDVPSWQEIWDGNISATS